MGILLHPAVIDVSACWGQYESIYVLFGLIAYLLASALWWDEPAWALKRGAVMAQTTAFGLYLASRFSVGEQLRVFSTVVVIALLVFAASALLDPVDRLLVKLRYEDELAIPEIARVLELPSRFHVYRRLDRVLVQLRGALEGVGVRSSAD